MRVCQKRIGEGARYLTANANACNESKVGSPTALEERGGIVRKRANEKPLWIRFCCILLTLCIVLYGTRGRLLSVLALTYKI